MPDVALLTSTMAQFDQVYKIGEFLKAKGSKIFLGGPRNPDFRFRFSNQGIG